MLIVLLTNFLDVEVVPPKHGVLLSQRCYILDILHQTNMVYAKPVLTPLPTSSTPTMSSGSPLSDPTEYRVIVGSLQYLSLTCLDISFTVNKLSHFMYQPSTEHWVLAKRLLRYLRGTLDEGVFFYRDSPFSLHAFSDADWAGNKDDFSSTSAYIVYLGRNPISWGSKKRRTIALFFTEAEYRSVAATVAKLT